MSNIDNSSRNAEIIRLRQQGWLPRRIRKHLGVSKNVVIGVLYRAGLSEPGAQYENQCRGEEQGGAKLTEQAVREIRATYKPGDEQCGKTALAKRFGVDVHTIYNVVKRHTWKHVE